MFRLRKHLKVGRVVVQAVFIFVVHYLSARERPTKYSFHNDTVFETLMAINVDEAIPGVAVELANVPISTHDEFHVMLGFRPVKGAP